MDRKGGILIPVLIILIIISLALAAGGFYSYQNEHTKSLQLQAQIEELNTRLRITENKFEESKKKATEFQLKLQEASAQIDSLTNELAQEKSLRLEASNKLEQLKVDLEQQKVLRQDIENRLNQAQDDGKKIKEQIKIMQQQKTELEAKIKNLESISSGVELGKVVVAPAPAVKPGKKSAAPAAPQGKSLEGKVMVVNKDYNFAVLNLGSKDGVNTGDEFSVYHAGKVIGVLKVEKVHESMAAAGFPEELKNIISENDKVAQKAK
jgi:flagellar basal body-associated protein FliL